MLELGIGDGRAASLQKRTIGDTNISDVFDGVNHIWPTRDDVAYFYDFNAILLRFIWSDSNGRDFDTGTNITNAPGITQEIVGWSWGSSENRTQPYLYWGGDNTSSGAECVMIDVGAALRFYENNTNYTMPEQLIVQLRGNWFGSRGDGIVTVECTAYKGGTIVKSYLLDGSAVGVNDLRYIFADKDGWIFEAGMSERLWIGEVAEINGSVIKINQVDDSIEGYPNLKIQREFNVGGSAYTSLDGYIIDSNGNTCKVWNRQVNVNGSITTQSSIRIFNTETNSVDNSIVISVKLLNENNSINSDTIAYSFTYGFVAGNSEKRGLQSIKSSVSSTDNNAADEEFAVVNYFDKTEAGQVVALNSIQ